MLNDSYGSVTSADGTSIGYRMIGKGPGLILVQGAMGTATNYDELARSLAASFTVYLPDRRGRGMSPLAYNPEHRIRRDIEDLASLVDHSGAPYIFGLSSGAIIALAAAAVLRPIEKAAVYEPPFVPEGISHPAIKQFNELVEQGRLAAALVQASRIVKLGPKILAYVPQWILRFGTQRLMYREQRQGSGRYAPLSELIPAMRYDFNVVGSMDGEASSFAALQKEVLLLGGDRSPDYLKSALTTLEKVLPNAQRIEFEGLDHSGPWNMDRGGNPEPIARALISFLVTDNPVASSCTI
ncbi:alpha/beta hydrolase [Acidisoma cellulosilytica]|uniref:Alpha/beta hydrolase n=1 Tax=Acidisoma cellulosilyticum TaxID=2802395 RepID=A0A963Z4U1_9PROT|nr:alpha/beta hydrolase [Acidisoma cellulosilyticum]MCB8882654.1 alpha/beta hydrolase [Acidisoma cellulosilyticum]